MRIQKLQIILWISFLLIWWRRIRGFWVFWGRKTKGKPLPFGAIVKHNCSLRVYLIGGRGGLGLGEREKGLHSMLDIRGRVCWSGWEEYFLKGHDDLWYLSEQVPIWVSFPMKLGSCRWKEITAGWRPPREKINASQLRQAREMLQTRLFLHIFRPNLKKNKITFFSGCFENVLIINGLAGSWQISKKKTW